MPIVIILISSLLFIPSAWAEPNRNPITSEKDAVLIEQLPSNVKLIIKSEEHPISIKPFQNELILRLTTEELWYKGSVRDRAFKKIEIINQGKTIFSRESNERFLKPIFYYYLTAKDTYRYYPYYSIDYKIYRGRDKDYFAYSETYGVYHIFVISDTFDINEVGGILLRLGSLLINNPKIAEHEYELMDGKFFLNGYANSVWFREIPMYYEIQNDKLVLRDVEFKVEQNQEWIDYIKECSTINLYNTYEMDYKTSHIVRITQKSNIKILGVRFWNTDSPDGIIPIIHIVVDAKEGWIDEVGCHERTMQF